MTKNFKDSAALLLQLKEEVEEQVAEYSEAKVKLKMHLDELGKYGCKSAKALETKIDKLSKEIEKRSEAFTEAVDKIHDQMEELGDE